jgi:hypothetical protein
MAAYAVACRAGRSSRRTEASGLLNPPTRKITL